MHGTLDQLPDEVKGLFETASQKWREAQRFPHRSILCLSLFRELSGSLHAERSRLLATGSRGHARICGEWERSLEFLFSDIASLRSPHSGDFFKILESIRSDSLAIDSLFANLPEALFEIIPREKWYRYDRKWETHLMHEVEFHQWHLWSLDSWVEISKIEKWNRDLISHLGTQGVFLFSEASRTSPEKAPDLESLLVSSGKNPELSFWHGIWYFAFPPSIVNAAEFRRLLPERNVAELLSAEWKLLFSPRPQRLS